MPTSSGPVRGRSDFERLPARSRDARGRALRALARMRSTGVSIKQASALEGTTASTVRRYAGSALQRRGARDVASPSDRLYRRMSMLTPTGRVDVDVRGAGAATRIGQHWNAVDHYLATGDRSAVAKFSGRRVGGMPFATDHTDIEAQFHRGELLIDEIYPSPN